MAQVSRIKPDQRKYLGGKDPDWLRTAAKQVRQTVDTPGWAALQELIQAQVDHLERTLIYGTKPLDHAQYAQITGQIRGVRALQKAAGDLFAEADRIEDEIRQRQTAAGGS